VHFTFVHGQREPAQDVVVAFDGFGVQVGDAQQFSTRRFHAANAIREGANSTTPMVRIIAGAM
jgi:hypothetical protein